MLGDGHQEQTAESEQDGRLDDGCRGQDEQREEDEAKTDNMLDVVDLPFPCLQSFYALPHVERGLEGGNIILRSCGFPTQPAALRYWVESRELEGWRPAEGKLLLLRLGRGEDGFEVLHSGRRMAESPAKLGASDWCEVRGEERLNGSLVNLLSLHAHDRLAGRGSVVEVANRY